MLKLILLLLKRRSNCGTLAGEGEAGEMDVDAGLWLLQCGDIEENPGPRVGKSFCCLCPESTAFTETQKSGPLDIGLQHQR